PARLGDLLLQPPEAVLLLLFGLAGGPRGPVSIGQHLFGLRLGPAALRFGLGLDPAAHLFGLRLGPAALRFGLGLGPGRAMLLSRVGPRPAAVPSAFDH